MRYYISDLHFFHKEMNELLVRSFQEQTRNTKRMIYGSDEPQPIPCAMINCFCMFSDYQPLTLDEWIENDRKRREEPDNTLEIFGNSVEKQ